ncbi:hypothetical protein JAAARDRAFT_43794 [Jaapia argillacea MUCL 33604]|uniref:Uncharacterized protein n=1 Tax=Jaapia argillacea MUCL 33604 TaxID=933084 RepID=A0A067QQM1_9AGAM|nr:hypothetical protein JAAARDRAFT_43794 [Jaapia argillacea MUCL 33604]
MPTVFGVQQENDPLIRTAEKGLEDLSAKISPGAFFVDALHFLRYVPAWFPGAGFQRITLGMRETLAKMGDVPLQIVESNCYGSQGHVSLIIFLLTGVQESGTAISSFTMSILSGPSLTKTQADNLKWAAASMYAGRWLRHICVRDTRVLPRNNPVYPNAQTLAQSDLDAVVGSDRLPSFSDKEQLPYLEALLKEVL